jgi:hypothetical protein
MWKRVSVCLGLLLLLPSIASAGAPGETAAVERDDDHDRHRVGGTLGLWTPIGAAGVNYTRMTRFVEVDVGAGLAFSGPQAAVMPRLRLGNDNIAFTLGVGLSVGRYRNEFECPDIDLDWTDDTDEVCIVPETVALWGNGEAGVAVTSRAGLFLRVFAGGGQIAATSGCDADPDECDSVDPGTFMPYGGVTLGQAF